MNKFQSCKTASMSKGKRNNDCSHCAILPPEIVADVLSRLPVKSLCRFKCVSPSWKSLISSPDFARTHLNRTNTNNPKHFDRNFTLISTTDDLYSVDHAAHVPIATKLDFPPLQQPEQRLSLLGSCNGLLLLSGTGKSNVFWFSQKNIFNLFLLNPSTRECKKLPPLPFVLDPGDRGIYVYGYGMGYDSSTDDYKVVMLSYYVSESGSESKSESESSPLSDMTIVAVYSLKTSAWRRIQDTHYTLDGCTAGVYYNGCLHWICRTDWSYLMFVFDLTDEIFREVPLPALDEFVDYHKVVIVGDCLSLVCKWDSFPLLDSGPVEVWMINEFGVRALWTKVMIDVHDKSYESYDLHGLLAEDEFLLTGRTLEKPKEDKLVAYNCKNGKLRDVMVHGIPTTFYTRRTYVESLVCPNQCNHGGGTGKQG